MFINIYNDNTTSIIIINEKIYVICYYMLYFKYIYNHFFLNKK